MATTAEILKASEKTAYGNEQVELSSAGRDIFVISDLHLAAGINANSNYEGTENFFADEAFCRFMTFMNTRLQTKPCILIINGDFIDFLRIINIPQQNELQQWSDALAAIGITKTTDELKNSITDKEKKYGLKTHDFKSVYRLLVCSKGHKQVFDGLGEWLSQGHQLVITKGNHDLEFYWKAVRDFLRLVFAKRVAALQNTTVEDALANAVLPQLLFVDDKLLIDGSIYIEHGHRYENFTAVYGKPLINNGEELNLPFGSFFNRYLINQIELAYPHIDDVRPRQNILPILIRERFPLAVKLLFCYIPFTLKIIPKGLYLHALRLLLQFVLVIVLPVAITGAAIYFSLPHPVHLPSTPSGILGMIFTQLKNLGLLILSYFLGRLMSMLQIVSINYLNEPAMKIFQQNATLQFVTFGHTHNPQQLNFENSGKRYYNTGTWMPVFEMNASDVREDKTYPFLHFAQDNSGEKIPKLMRWNDDALRAESLVMIERK